MKMKYLTGVCASVLFLSACGTASSNGSSGFWGDTFDEGRSVIAQLISQYGQFIDGVVHGYETKIIPNKNEVVIIKNQADFDKNFQLIKDYSGDVTKFDFKTYDIWAVLAPPSKQRREIIGINKLRIREVGNVKYADLDFLIHEWDETRAQPTTPQFIFKVLKAKNYALGNVVFKPFKRDTPESVYQFKSQ